VIRNLSIGAAAGGPPVDIVINCLSAAVFYLENVPVFGGNVGIVAGPAGYLVARNVIIRQTGTAGLSIQGTGASVMSVALDHVAIDVAGAGGIAVTTAHAVLNLCSVTHALGAAISAAAASAVDVEDSTFAFSGTGLGAYDTGTTIRIAGNSIHDNQTGILPTGGGQILSFGTNWIAGNGADGSPSGTVALK
jgi:hypothetical protein